MLTYGVVCVYVLFMFGGLDYRDQFTHWIVFKTHQWAKRVVKQHKEGAMPPDLVFCFSFTNPSPGKR